MALGSGVRPQRIRDPLHDLIEFDIGRFEQMLWSVIQSGPFQRLRRVRQLGFSEFVYPGATHTRFAHSLGVFHNARRLMRIIEQYLGKEQFDQYRAEAALTAALLHDIGHGPFSHSFESIGEKLNLKYAKHENVSDEIIQNTEVSRILESYHNGMSSQVAGIVNAGADADIYSAVVSSQFDADRLDYMQRDRLMTGTQHSEIDLTWLIANLGISEVLTGVDEKETSKIPTFVLKSKAIYAAETYVVSLFQLYPTVYFHKATRSAEKVFFYLFERIFRLIQDGRIEQTGLSKTNPISRFATNPNSLATALDLDDSVIWASLSELCASKDTYIQQLSTMLKERRLPKALDIRTGVEKELGNESHTSDVVDDAIRRIIDELDLREPGPDEGVSDIPPIWIDTAKRVPYRELEEDTGRVNQINIWHNGELVDLKDVSSVVRAIHPFKLDRAYIPFEPDVLQEQTRRTIKQKTREVAGK